MGQRGMQRPSHQHTATHPVRPLPPATTTLLSGIAPGIVGVFFLQPTSPGHRPSASHRTRSGEVPLRELAGRFGLSRADNLPNLTPRVEAKLSESLGLSEEVRQIVDCWPEGSPSPGLVTRSDRPEVAEEREIKIQA